MPNGSTVANLVGQVDSGNQTTSRLIPPLLRQSPSPLLMLKFRGKVETRSNPLQFDNPATAKKSSLDGAMRSTNLRCALKSRRAITAKLSRSTSKLKLLK